MKKLIALILVLVLTLSLSACQEKPADNTTKAPEATQDATPGSTETTGAVQTDPATTTTAPNSVSYAFVFENQELIPGAAFDAAALPEAAFVYEVPSCAFEGTDKVYNYQTFELTAFDDGTGPVIYSIFLVDANTPTTEGLYLGDDISRVTELYGQDCQIDGAQYAYIGDGMMLVILIQNDFVTSIEYRMVTE